MTPIEALERETFALLDQAPSMASRVLLRPIARAFFAVLRDFDRRLAAIEEKHREH